MNIMELGAIGERVGGVAVIGSLIYVGLRVKQNTNTVRASSFHALTEALCNFNIRCSEADMASIYVRGIPDLDALTPEERFQFSAGNIALFRLFESAFYQWQRGILDDAVWQPFEATVRMLMRAKGNFEWWNEMRVLFQSNFCEYMDRILAEIAEDGQEYSWFAVRDARS